MLALKSTDSQYMIGNKDSAAMQTLLPLSNG